MEKQSIMDMAKGAFKERIDYEMAKIMDNILDVNTNPTKKRKLTVSIELIPDETRSQIQVKTTAKSTLEPTVPISTSLYITGDTNGEVTAIELTPQVPGQLGVDGTEQQEPAALRLVKGA